MFASDHTGAHIAYLAATLGLLALFGIVWTLIGRPVLRLILGGNRPQGAEGFLLTLATGMAGSMVLLAVLGVFGVLNGVAVAAVVALALLANLAMAVRRHGASPIRGRDGPARLLAGLRRHAFRAGIVCLVSLPALVSAVTGSVGGDSYMYHLPQARLIADTGRLAVDEQLQVPLHPHYYHLLYAVALLVWDDRLANAIHAASAVLSVLGLYFLGRVWVGRGAALLACAMYLTFAATIHSAPSVAVSAYVGYGTAVFTLFAYHCLGRALADADGRMLCLACLLMGVSLGIKTQAWVGVPAFAALALAACARIRRPGPAAAACLVAAVAGGFWYVRSFLVSGDPFHPLGGNLFGHWAWNAADLEETLEWIAARSGLDALQWLLVAPALAMLPFAHRSLRAARRGGPAPIADRARSALALASLAGLATWIATSFHDRFLLSIAPVILLASATAVATVLGRVRGGSWATLATAFAVRVRKTTPRWVATILAATASVLGLVVVGQHNANVCGGFYCSTILDGIEARRLLGEFDAKDRLRIYELYLSHGNYYFLDHDVLGAWVGPSRYRDLVAFGGDGAAIAAHLAALGRNALLVNVLATGGEFPLSGSFLDHFAPCGRHGRAALFVRRNALPEDAGNWPPRRCRGTPATDAGP
ncbi:MAG: hypothetical protein OXU77_14385 [Gammaproteobacteria bacterium]|nr:hypothetical protein [Gammaproteobacteria bacterium]MDE0440581.1 hypothetical protein [Gammaproteobacteria bacterium]